MPRKTRLADLQLAIMEVLWTRGEASVGDVKEALHDSRPLAYTTIGTMLAKLEEKGLVTHRVDGRVNIYRSLVPREKVSRSMVDDLVERLFAGDVAGMVCHLLEDANVSRDELNRVKAMLRQKEKELRRDE
jgi:predicted transcriptional regulator